MPEGSAELAVTEDVLHRGAVPVPVLGGHRLVWAGHVQVGQDERVGVDRPGTGQLGERQGALVRVQGAAPPGARVGRDLLRVQQAPGGSAAGCPPATSPGSTRRRRSGRRPCLSHRASRPRRGRPAAATAARSAWRRSRSRCARRGRRGPAARRSIRRRRAAPPGPKPAPPRAGRPGRGAADPARSRAGHRSRRPGRRPARSPSPPSWPRAAAHPLALVVIGHAALLAAVDLHVGGVQVDRDRPIGQRRRPRRGQHCQHPPGHRRQAGLHRLPLRRGDPPGQARRGRGTQSRHRRDLLPGRISTLAVQPDQEVLPGQLRRGQPRQQLPGPEPAVPLLDRTDRPIQRADHAEPVTQPGDGGQARVRRQRRIRRADPRLLPRLPAPLRILFTR